jgi:hypothetical protein
MISEVETGPGPYGLIRLSSDWYADGILAIHRANRIFPRPGTMMLIERLFKEKIHDGYVLVKNGIVFSREATPVNGEIDAIVVHSERKDFAPRFETVPIIATSAYRPDELMDEARYFALETCSRRVILNVLGAKEQMFVPYHVRIEIQGKDDILVAEATPFVRISQTKINKEYAELERAVRQANINCWSALRQEELWNPQETGLTYQPPETIQ